MEGRAGGTLRPTKVKLTRLSLVSHATPALPIPAMTETIAPTTKILKAFLKNNASLPRCKVESVTEEFCLAGCLSVHVGASPDTAWNRGHMARPTY